MRFWLTVILGAVVVTAISTTLYFLSPEISSESKTAVVDSDTSVAPKGKIPKVVAEQTQEERSAVPQEFTGESRFVLRNAGEAPLSLRLGNKSCTCVEFRFEGNGASKQSDQAATVAPGDSVQAVLGWKTEHKVGRNGLNAVITTNDPLKQQVTLVVTLNIERDLIVGPDVLNFGELTEGAKASQSCLILAPLQEKVQFTDPVPTLPQFRASITPLSPEELTKQKAKSGVKLTVDVDGMLPVGDLLERVEVKTTSTRVPRIGVPIMAYVRGKIDATPNRIDFGVVSGSHSKVQKVSISARGLPPERSLKVLSHDPSFLKVRLTKDPKLRVIWRLEVEIPAGAPAGEFKGQVSIGDDQGAKRLNLAVKGTVTGIPIPVAQATSPPAS